MSRTEAAAKKLWCPFSRVVAGQNNIKGETEIGPDQGSFNRVATGAHQTVTPHGAMCIGAGCMAWRWWKHSPPDQKMGFCGLAGELR